MATVVSRKQGAAAALSAKVGGNGAAAERVGTAAGGEGDDAQARLLMTGAAAVAALPSIQKAAILLVGLGPELAAPILKTLPDEQIEQITLEIFKLGAIDEALTDAIFVEAYERSREAAVDRGGQEYAKELLTKALDRSKASTLLEKVSGKLAAGPFDFLRDVDAVQLVNMIQGEHPQAIALILAHLPPAQGAQILSGLPPDAQADIARRLATMERTSPDVVQEVETQLKRRMTAVVAPRHTRVGGIPYLVNVLNSVDRAAEKTIMESLEEQTPELADEIRKNMFTFEDIVKLTDRDMQRIWREVEQKQVALALRGATDDVKEKFLRNTSQRNRQALLEEVDLLGPTRLSAIEEAQQQIVTIIRRLEQAEEIQVTRGAGEQLV